VASYAQGHFVEADEQANEEAVQVAHTKAAKYYLQMFRTKYPSREKRQGISDVEPLIEAIWQYCQAQQWQEDYNLMEQERIFVYLKAWGGCAILLELYKLLLPPEKWHAERLQAAHIYNNLGVVYRVLGKMERARDYLKQALDIYEEERDRKEGRWLLYRSGRIDALIV